jgi:hypothetical protein
VDAGKHLQLPIYAIAATQLAPSRTSTVRAEFRFVGSRAARSGEFAIGLELDEGVRARLLETVDVLTSTVAAGLFPMVPGTSEYRGFTHCRFCDFNSICPTGRERYEESARALGSLDTYFDLVRGLGDEADSADDPETDGRGD